MVKKPLQPAEEGAGVPPHLQEVRNPNLTTAIQQLATSKVNTVSAGCLMGSFPGIRQYVAAAWEQVLQGRPAREALARYNASVGR